MIDETKIKEFFSDIKSRNLIPPISEYHSFVDNGDVITVRYNVKVKIFSYKVNKSFILSELRRIKLESLFR